MTLFSIRQFLQRCKSQITANRIRWTLFFTIFCVGIFARTWEFRKLPPGLNADEASIGLEAYNLYHYGLDRNGVSYPVHFISWGSGQNALYGYLLIPFIALLGLTPAVVRLPMLLSGILSMPLVYIVAQRTFDQRMGLLSMFFLAISPWHIMLSRFGLESNIFPFVFLAGYACLVEATRNSRWFLLACFLFALCFYAYGTSYFIVPFFLVGSLWILVREKLICRQDLAIGLSLLCLLAIPIGLFIAINTIGLNTVYLGPATIPRLPTQARFLSESTGLQTGWPATLLENIWNLISLLFKQTDGLIYNAFEPYGYFYKVTFPLAIIGAMIVFQRKKLKFNPKISMLFLWLIACLSFGVLQPVNINRLNDVFIPLLICVAAAVDWLGRNIKPILPMSVCGLLIAFLSFTIDYHGESYRNSADMKFHTGLLAAIQYASKIGPGAICVTDRIDMPYIFVLFVEKPNPTSYLNSIQYVDPISPFRQVRSLSRYTFGKQNCPSQSDTVYLLRSDDGRPKTGIKYQINVFDDYYVFYPRP